jgi:sulfur carrier protein
MRILLNGQPREIEGDRASVSSLIREMRLEGKRIAVERNGEIVPRSRHAETTLEEGDKLEIVGAVGGG